MSINNQILSTRREYEYHELANEYLAKINFASIEDFKAAKVALSNFLSKGELPPENSNFRDTVESLNDLLQYPEMYAQTKEEQAVFKDIVSKRIAMKVDELAKLSKNEMTKEVISQNISKKKVKINRELMKRVKPPEKGSEARTISELAMLIEMQNRPEFTADTAPHANFSMLSPELRDQLFANGATVSLLAGSQISLEDLIHLEEAIRADLFKHPIDVTNLIKAGMTLESFAALDASTRIQLLTNSDKIIQLVKYGMPIDIFIQQDESLRQELLSNHIKVRVALRQSAIPFDQLINLEKNLRSNVIPNLLHVVKLVKAGSSLERISELDEAKQAILMQNIKSIAETMKTSGEELNDVLEKFNIQIFT